jgi:uncharacterized membrane protein
MKHNALLNNYNHLPAAYKLIIAFPLSGIFFLLLLPIRMEWITRIMIWWDIFSFLLIAMSTFTFCTIRPRQIRLLARIQDASRTVVFITIMVTNITSLFGIFILLVNKNEWLLNKYLETFIYIFGVTCSWVLLHITFTYRYAHLYYEDHETIPNEVAAGLEIAEKYPDYLDFAYFSFVIGMTFQVSDIRITSRSIRRLALVHGLLSFLFNTVIVALSINVIIDLKI